ncbi:MAG: AbiEi antitoxin N-terminal domain-containing protein [Thermoanaerobaculia bacterium]
MTSHSEAALDLAREKGLVRPRDLAPRGIPRVTLTRLVRSGRLAKIGRGLYALPHRDVTEHQGLAETAKRVPHGVVCLLSALRFHGLTTQDPFEVWLAIDRKARRPQQDHPPLRIVRFPARALAEGVEEHQIEGVKVRITSPARTVVDCFRYRSKVGLDVAIEALRDYRRGAAGTADELWKAAGVARSRSVIRPYLEALA